MSAAQVVGVLIIVGVLWITLALLRGRRKRWTKPLSQRNVRTWSKSDKWQPWR